MLAFVAGATGYTGRAVVAELRGRGIEVLAHARAGSSRLEGLREGWAALGAEVDTTPWEAEALTARMAERRPDLVFALLGVTRAGAKREGRATGERPSYETVDYGLTVALADACVAAGVAPRFVYLSSLGAGPRAVGDYLRWRWRAEERLRASGLPLTIARPSFITGPDRDESRPAERIGAVAARGVLGVIGALGGRRLKRRYGPRTGEDLARALVDAALDPARANATLESEDLG